MDKEYVIKISMTPHYHDNIKHPYYWCILSNKDGWINEGSGWSSTPDQAFIEAKMYLNFS